MFVLTKFFEKESYRDQFIDGNLYLLSFSTFTQTIPERPLDALAENGNDWAIEKLKKQHNIDQRDIFEGGGTVSLENCLNEIDKGLIPLICMDPSIRGSGFDYCNLTCLCKIDINYLLLKSPCFVYTVPDMRNFGKYAIIIKDIDAFAKRVGKSLNKLGYHYNMGSVMYHQPSFYEGFNNHMPHETVICDPEIKLDDPYLYRKHAYDCFDKAVTMRNKMNGVLSYQQGRRILIPFRLMLEV